MTFKTKAIGLLAGSALLLSVVSGALANDATVTLEDNPDASAGCHASIMSGSFDLGTWQWSSSGYVQTSTGNGGSLGFNLTQDVSAGTINCFVEASGSPLVQQTDADGNAVTGGASINLAFNVNTTGTSLATVPTSSSGAGGGIVVSMSDLGSQPAGNYTGTVSVTATTSS